MKFTNEIVINAPRARLVELLDQPELMTHWQPELMGREPISGTPGQPGAKARLKYKFGDDAFDMIETVTVRNLPVEFSGTYEARGMVNTITQRLEEIGPNQTKLRSTSSFTWGGNPALWCLGWVMKGTFRKRAIGYLNNFKAFAEKQGV